jgi:hypothetical protein
MKKMLLAVFMALVSLVAVVAVLAQGPGIAALPGGGWWEATQVMNVGTLTATVAFDPIAGVGVTESADPANTTIGSGASKTFMPQFGDVPLTMDDGFQGSAIVSSDQPIVAIGQVANNDIAGVLGVTGGRASAMYPGISGDALATTVAFPLVKNNYKGKTTTFYIQTAEAGTIHVTYSMNEGANQYNTSATTTVDGQMATFSPDDIGTMPKDCSDATCLGAAVFTSTVPLAGIYVEHNTSDTPAQILLSTRGFTLADFDTTVVFPNVKSVWKGRTTGIQIMNASLAPSSITVTLAYQAGSASGADGQSVVFNNVLPGTSRTFFPGNHGIFDGPFGGGGPDEFVGSATVTSDQNIVGICNENDFAAPATTKQTVYAGFAASAATDSVLFPLVKEFYRGSQTGLQIMNVGDDAVDIEADYVFDNGTFTVDEDSGGSSPITLDPGEPFTFWGVTDYWSGDYDTYKGGFGAVTVSATGSGETLIVGIAQEAEFPAGGVGYLDTKNYEGFNQ